LVLETSTVAYLIGFDIDIHFWCRWVTAAKSLVYGKCAIDMLAGPSECLVIADSTGLPLAPTIAADLLAQAEHDTAAVPILVSDSEAVVHAVNAEILRQIKTLPTAPTASVSVGKVRLEKARPSIFITNTRFFMIKSLLNASIGVCCSMSYDGELYRSREYPRCGTC
jgi:hypothetical protein